MKQTHESVERENNEVSMFSQLILGKYFDIIVFSCFLLSLLEVYTYVNSSRLEDSPKYFIRFFAILLEFSMGILYTLHFIAIVIFFFFHEKFFFVRYTLGSI